jgi:hypothetical protein
MLYAHVFGVVAEFILGCTIFAALFAAPLAVSIKVLIGAFVLSFAVTTDGQSSEGEHQAHVIMALVNAVPIHTDLRMKNPNYNLKLEVSNAASEMQSAYSRGGIHVAVQLAKYALWVAVGWLVGAVLL